MSNIKKISTADRVTGKDVEVLAGSMGCDLYGLIHDDRGRPVRSEIYVMTRESRPDYKKAEATTK